MTSKTTRYFTIAAAIGIVHAAFSGYWATGQQWVLGTVGTWATDWVDSQPTMARSVLVALTVLKLAAAVLPLLARLGRVPFGTSIFAISWAGSILLIAWGGASFIGAGIGLILTRENQVIKIGHLFFDSAFFLWGAALLTGLVLQHRARSSLARR